MLTHAPGPGGRRPSRVRQVLPWLPAASLGVRQLLRVRHTGTVAVRVELTRFRVLPGRGGVVEEWMAFLRDHEQAVRQTLGPEHMHVETIFSETVDGVEYLYWYSVQGEGGNDVTSSGHWLDRAHLDYWRRCIDPSFPPEDLTVRQHVVTAAVQDAIDDP